MEAIAAISENGVIGKEGQIPWKCKEDMAWFKKMTTGRNVVVGRTTFDTLPFLPNRKVWVLGHKNSQSKIIHKYAPGDLHFVNDIDFLPKDCIIAGGAKVYETLLPHCSTLYLTVIKQKVDGDTFFPKFSHLFPCEDIIDNGPGYEIYKLTRKYA